VITGDPDERRAIVENALFGSPVITQIEWTGTGNVFAANLVRVLTSYGTLPSGKPALMAIMEALKTYRGVDVQAELDDWIKQLHPAATVPDPTTTIRDDLYVFISYVRPCLHLRGGAMCPPAGAVLCLRPQDAHNTHETR
jgi:hypothetical protein